MGTKAVKQDTVARSELILGGQRSGKSRRAEQLAQRWLTQSSTHRALYLATVQALDEKMQARIQHHQYVDALGTLNQHMAALRQRVTLMTAGLPLTLKDE